MATPVRALLICIACVLQQVACALPPSCLNQCSLAEQTAHKCSLTCDFDLTDLLFLATLQSDSTTPYESLSFSINSELTQVKQGAFSNPIFHNVSRLTLNFNQIETIERGAFEELKNLKSLLLNNNNISSLQGGMFDGLYELAYFSLGRNEINAIESSAFKGLSGLKLINLSNNRLTAINKDIFKHIPQLFSLDLSGNQIKAIEHDNFIGLSSLFSLDLHDNQITDLHPQSFKGLENLFKLNLGKNPVNHFHSHLFGTTPYLTIIDLSDSRFKTIPHVNSTTITDIKLKNCTLEKIPSNLFSNLVNLEKIDFSDNAISLIPAGLFGGLTKLNEINLDTNRLRTVSVKTFEELYPSLPEGEVPKKVSLVLTNNPWNCQDAGLKATIAWCHQKSVPARFPCRTNNVL